MKGFFITGTDTGVGKTTIALALLNDLKQKGLLTAALKPIASGCKPQTEQLFNDDALLLQQAATLKLNYQDVNPFAFKLPIAPMLAAKLQKQTLSCQALLAHYAKICSLPIDYLIVEGAGGWRQPLNEQETLAHFASAIKLPVILVVGIRLGCINHALLTAESVLQDGLSLAGWVANIIDPFLPHTEEVITLLKSYLKVPLLGLIPFQTPMPLVQNLNFLLLNIGRQA